MKQINISVSFDDEQKQCAASVYLEAFLRSRGEKLISSGGDKRLARAHAARRRAGCRLLCRYIAVAVCIICTISNNVPKTAL